MSHIRAFGDADGDTIPDSYERRHWLLPKGDASQVRLDPYSADTDGDGLRDDEEISLEEVETEYSSFLWIEELHSNPADPDTDGDTIGDEMEVDGWEVDLIATHSDAQSFQSATADPDTNAGQFVSNPTVRSDPYDRDSDDDTLSDEQEFELGTDPSGTDSDGDSIPDARELEVNEDPTMFDITPPEIRVVRSNYNNVIHSDILDGNVGVEGQYFIEARVNDPSGERNYTVKLDGKKRVESLVYSDLEEPLISEVVVVGLDKALLTGLQTNKLRLTVADDHGNQKTVTGFSSSNFYIQAGEELEVLNDLSPEEAAGLGYVSGVSKSAGGMGETIRKAMMDPVGYVEQAADYKQYVALVENADKLPGAMVQQYQQEMRVTNPYYDPQAQQVKHESNYKAFEKGYYAGVATFEVALSAARGSGAATKFKKLKTVQKAASEPKVAKALSYYRKAQKAKAGAKAKYLTGPAAKTGYRIGKATDEVLGRSDIASKVIRRTRTVGQQWRVSRHLRKVDPQARDALGDYSGDLSRLLSKHGEDGVEFINDLGPEKSKDFFEISKVCRRNSIVLYRGYGVQSNLGGSPCGIDSGVQVDVSDAFEARVLQLYKQTDGEFPDGRFVSAVKQMEDEQQERFMENVAKGRYHMKDFKSGDKDQYDELNDISLDSDSTTFRAEKTGLDGDSIDMYARYFDEGEQAFVDAVARKPDRVKKVLEAEGMENLADGLDLSRQGDVKTLIQRVNNIDSGSDSSIRGKIFEDAVVPVILENKKGYDMSFNRRFKEHFDEGEFSGSDHGFDGLAVDKDGNLVIIEAKAVNSNGRVTPSEYHLGGTDAGEQMSDAWIQSKFNEMALEAQTNPQKAKLLADLDSKGYIDYDPSASDIEVQFQNVQKEVVAMQDAPTSGTMASDVMRRSSERVIPDVVQIDTVEVLKFGQVFSIGGNKKANVQISRNQISSQGINQCWTSKHCGTSSNMKMKRYRSQSRFMAMGAKPRDTGLDVYSHRELVSHI